MKNLLLFSLFLGAFHLFAQSPEVAKESIDQIYEHRFDEPRSEEADRAVATEKKELKIDKKEEGEKVKYWKYQQEIDPKY